MILKKRQIYAGNVSVSLAREYHIPPDGDSVVLNVEMIVVVAVVVCMSVEDNDGMESAVANTNGARVEEQSKRDITGLLRNQICRSHDFLRSLMTVLERTHFNKMIT